MANGSFYTQEKEGRGSQNLKFHNSKFTSGRRPTRIVWPIFPRSKILQTETPLVNQDQHEGLDEGMC